MKAILAGINIYKYLGLQTLLAKIIGIVSANAAGLSIGKEGPFVHISGIIAHKLTNLRFFRNIKANHTLSN
jgi:chloride channel 2